VAKSEPTALLDAAISFDFRPLFGDGSLAVALREWVHPLARANPAFLRFMAESALESRPPLGMLRDFATDVAHDRPHSVNLKLNGARPFIDSARIYALAHGISHTNTAERLRAVRTRIGMGVAEAEGLIRAFFLIQGLRLRVQAGMQPGEEGANHVEPDKLDDFERRVLKEAFLQARKLQSRLALDYQI